MSAVLAIPLLGSFEHMRVMLPVVVLVVVGGWLVVDGSLVGDGDGSCRCRSNRGCRCGGVGGKLD